MRLLQFAARHNDPERLTTNRLLLRRPESSDYEQWADLRAASADFLQPFEPAWSRNELSRSAYRARLRRHEAEINSGRGLPWFLFEKDGHGRLLGGLTLSNIRWGVAETGTLGYWMGEPYAGRGLMSEAVMAVCKHVFEVRNLHRIEAATVLDNQRSQSLLLRCGFQREGVARSYLKINNRWRDHALYSRIASDPAPTP